MKYKAVRYYKKVRKQKLKKKPLTLISPDVNEGNLE